MYQPVESKKFTDVSEEPTAFTCVAGYFVTENGGSVFHRNASKFLLGTRRHIPFSGISSASPVPNLACYTNVQSSTLQFCV